MAIVLEANYAKKLGLPNFSSHQYSVTIRTELTDLNQVDEASGRLYGLLQDAVDREIQHVGYMPDASTYGMNPPANGQRNGNGQAHPAEGSDWQCSDKQRGLIEKIVREHQLDKNEVETLAQDLFGVGVRSLNRLQASGLIDELLEKHGQGRRKGNGNGYHRSRERRNVARGGGE